MFKLIALLFIAVIAIPFSFFLGLSFGSSAIYGFDGGEMFRRFSGTLGDWVAGLGALSAALVAVYLAERARKDRASNISVKQFCTTDFYYIDLVSSGDRRAVVRGISIKSSKHDRVADISRRPILDRESLPLKMEHGDVEWIQVSKKYFPAIMREIRHEMGSGDLGELSLNILTTTDSYTFPLHDELYKYLLATEQ